MASRTSKKAPKKELNMKRAVELRVRGYSYRAIGTSLGVSVKTAHQYVKESLDEAIKERKEAADHALDIQLQQVDGVIRGLAPMCIPEEDATYTEINDEGEEVPVDFKPNSKAVAELIKYLDHKAKLLGHYVKPEEVRTKEPLPWSDDD